MPFPGNLYNKEGTPDVHLMLVAFYDCCKRKRAGKMATPYEDEKISAHDAAQISEHHTKPSAAATMDPERRKQVEKSLKRKLDARCSLFVLIYIMNCKTTIRPKIGTQLWITE